jgi:hypothetical protein
MDETSDTAPTGAEPVAEATDTWKEVEPTEVPEQPDTWGESAPDTQPGPIPADTPRSQAAALDVATNPERSTVGDNPIGHLPRGNVETEAGPKTEGEPTPEPKETIRHPPESDKRTSETGNELPEPDTERSTDSHEPPKDWTPGGPERG